MTRLCRESSRSYLGRSERWHFGELRESDCGLPGNQIENPQNPTELNGSWGKRTEGYRETDRTTTASYSHSKGTVSSNLP